MALASSVTMPKLSRCLQTSNAKALATGTCSPCLSIFRSRTSSFMSQTGAVRKCCLSVGRSNSRTQSLLGPRCALFQPESHRRVSTLQETILNPQVIREVVKHNIAREIRKDESLVKPGVLLQDLNLDPVTQVAIEVNIEDELDGLLRPIKIITVEMPFEANATIEDFVKDIYDKLIRSITNSVF